MTPAETTEYFNLAGDVLTSFTEAASRVIVGDMTIEEYRALISSLEATNLGKMDEIYATAYDRYLNG